MVVLWQDKSFQKLEDTVERRAHFSSSFDSTTPKRRWLEPCYSSPIFLLVSIIATQCLMIFWHDRTHQAVPLIKYAHTLTAEEGHSDQNTLLFIDLCSVLKKFAPFSTVLIVTNRW